jgi:hypothetical protein
VVSEVGGSVMCGLAWDSGSNKVLYGTKDGTI